MHKLTFGFYFFFYGGLIFRFYLRNIIFLFKKLQVVLIFYEHNFREMAVFFIFKAGDLLSGTYGTSNDRILFVGVK